MDLEVTLIQVYSTENIRACAVSHQNPIVLMFYVGTAACKVSSLAS
jgi:hypothetical protein